MRYDYVRHRMTLHAHPRYLVVTDVAVLLLMEALLFGLSRARLLLSPLAFWLISAALIIAVVLDVAAWYWRGVRSVEAGEEVITVYRGRSLTARAFPRSAITRLKVRRLPGARGVLLRAASGQRERISEQAFPRDEFTRFLSAMELWER